MRTAHSWNLVFGHGDGGKNSRRSRRGDQGKDLSAQQKGEKLRLPHSSKNTLGGRKQIWGGTEPWGVWENLVCRVEDSQPGRGGGGGNF